MRLPSKPYDQAAPLALMHVPKAAGTSVKLAIRDALHTQLGPWGYDREFFGNYDAFEEIQPPNRAVVFFPGASDRGNARFVGGHISLSTLASSFPEFQLMTIVREPVTRILSNWVFLRGMLDAELAPWGPEWARRNRLLLGSLRDFMSVPENIPISDNLLTRMLLRPHPLIPQDGPIEPMHDDEITALAMAQLQNFAFIDAVENPRMADNLSGWLGRPLVLERINETTRVAEEHRVSMVEQVTSEVLEMMEHFSRLDRVLWDFVMRERMGERGPWLATRSFFAAFTRYTRLMGC